MKSVHISTKVENRIESLNRSGKAGKAVARKATFILERLVSGAVPGHTDAIGSCTRYGEKRIRNCRKYDLGCGYRLITLQRGGKVFVPFLGTHDECQRWLENNSRLKDVVAGDGALFQVSREAPEDDRSVEPVAEAADELFLSISDRELRQVFCGLVQAAAKRHRRAHLRIGK